MLPPFIIEQIRKREIEERRRGVYHQPTVELPLPLPAPPTKREVIQEPEERGVVVIEL